MNSTANSPTVPLSQAALDYARIERAILFLQERYLQQPALATVARAVHMSEYHFQRVFSRWAGISPKRFLQFLTIEHAKQQLLNSKPVLEAALDSGLSSPSRLHDLFLNIEAVTPGEYKTRGGGIQIHYGFAATPFGRCLLGRTGRGICWLSFFGNGGEETALDGLKDLWRNAELIEGGAQTLSLVNRIFSNIGHGNKKPLSLLLMGSNFQIKVWQALLRIPMGALVSYEALGHFIGAPRASRAIGSAVGANPIAYLIPCHRVIRKQGLWGGYRWGQPRKQAILAWEAARGMSNEGIKEEG